MEQDVKRLPQPGSRAYYLLEIERYTRALSVVSERNKPYLQKRIACCGDCLRMLENGCTEDEAWEYDSNFRAED